MNEFEIIERFVGKVGEGGESPLLGPGDDAALWDLAPDEVEAVSVDLLVEDVHFRNRYCSPSEIGYKSIVVNLSDLAAMGARPRFGLIGLALRKDDSQAWIEGFSEGVREACQAFGFSIVGGDLTGSPGPTMISVTAVGGQKKGKVLLRSGAAVGDDIWVAGWLGLSRAALENLEQGRERREIPKACLDGYFHSVPKLKEGLWLAEEGLASAAIDVSDGLLGDLAHILERSGVGAEIEVSNIPVHADLLQYFSGDREKAEGYALNGGEDYALAFTASVEKRQKILKEWPEISSEPLHRIGRIVVGEGCSVLSNGSILRKSSGGFDHFK